MQTRIPLNQNSSMLDRAQMLGHKQRTGHELTGYYTPITEGEAVLKLVRTCACATKGA